jgi:hypothetical protein
MSNRLHNEIPGVALKREGALLALLIESERDTLIALLKRPHENLPAVESATARNGSKRFPRAAARYTRARASDHG